MATQPKVIPALMQALAEAREASGKDHRHVRNFTRTSERMLSRYEEGTHCPPGANIDEVVAAYAAAIGADSPLDLWQRAVDRAREAEVQLRRDLDLTEPGAGAKAARSARDAGRAVGARRQAKRRGRGASG